MSSDEDEKAAEQWQPKSLNLKQGSALMKVDGSSNFGSNR